MILSSLPSCLSSFFEMELNDAKILNRRLMTMLHLFFTGSAYLFYRAFFGFAIRRPSFALRLGDAFTRGSTEFTALAWTA